MKLSLSNFSANQYLKYGKTQRETLQAIRDCGFTCIDLDILPSYLDGDLKKNAEDIKEMLSEIGLSATMAHAPCINPLKHPKEALESVIKTLRFCKLIGTPCVVVHPGAIRENTREAFFEENVAFYRSLIPYAEETDVCVLVENIGNYDDPYFLWNGFDLREMLDRIDHPLFAACWDIGHANHFFAKDCDQYQSIVALGDKLAAIHAHDNCGYIADTYKHSRMDLHTLPCFASPASVNWDAVLQGLQDIDYQGTFNFEVKSPAASEREDFIYRGESVRRLNMMPLDVWVAVNTALYKMGRFMLEMYGLYEE